MQQESELMMLLQKELEDIRIFASAYKQAVKRFLLLHDDMMNIKREMGPDYLSAKEGGGYGTVDEHHEYYGIPDNQRP